LRQVILNTISNTINSMCIVLLLKKQWNASFPILRFDATSHTEIAISFLAERLVGVDSKSSSNSSPIMSYELLQDGQYEKERS
jgi:hypothetical protein